MLSKEKMQFKELTLKSNPENKNIHKLIDYTSFCSEIKVKDEVECDIESISIKELKVLLSQSSKEMLLIDVRNQNEYNQCSITGSLLMPLSSIESGKAIDEIKILTAKKNLYVFCKSGKRSLLALKHLNKFGIRGINILGGIDAWNNEKN